MRSFDEICQSIGYNRNVSYPARVYKTIGYCKGAVLGEFDDETSAKKAGATVTEKVCKNEKEYTEFKANVIALENKASDIWAAELKEENFGCVKASLLEVGIHSDGKSQEVYNIIYSRAYERGHSSGYDEVANCMDSEISYFQEIFNAL